jgi:hypothetical protein
MGLSVWCLNLWEEHGMRFSGNSVPRRKCRPKRKEVTGEWRKCIIKSFVNNTLYPILLSITN